MRALGRHRDNDVAARGDLISSMGPLPLEDTRGFECVSIMTPFSGKGLFRNKLPWTSTHPPIKRNEMLIQVTA